MPVELIIDREGLKAGHNIAVLTNFRVRDQYYAKAAGELDLKYLQYLQEGVDLEVTVGNKSEVIEELLSINSWPQRYAPAEVAECNDSNVKRVIEMIERYVDEHCRSAWIG